MSSATFPRRLRESSDRAGISIRALAAKALVNPRSITGWRAGQCMPGIDTTERLAAALGVEAAWLAYGVELAIPRRVPAAEPAKSSPTESDQDKPL